MAKETYDLLFQIVLIGDCGVAKTQLRFRFTYGIFRPTLNTIGVEGEITVVYLNDKKIKLRIWDTSGHERFLPITTPYYPGAKGIMFVYDITQEKTFDNIAKWLKHTQEHTTEDVVKMLLGNKCDLEDKRMVSKERGEKFAKENGMKFFETSSKKNINVEEAFMTMTEDILKKKNQKDSGSPGLVRPDTKERDSSQSQRCF